MHLDEFESQFKSAIKVPYAYEEIDTRIAEQTLHDTLLKLPHDFVGSARACLRLSSPN